MGTVTQGRRFSERRDAQERFPGLGWGDGLQMKLEIVKRLRLTGKRDAGQGRGKKRRETGSKSE